MASFLKITATYLRLPR